MWKSPLTQAATWKRIHYDHHSDPNNLKVLFGALYTTLPTVALATMPGSVICLPAGSARSRRYARAWWKPRSMNSFIASSTWAISPNGAGCASMKKFHMAHHFHNENGNYGITNLFWDNKVLGTFYVGAADRPRSATVFNLGYDEEVARVYPFVARLTPNWPYTANPVQRKREMAEQAVN